MSTFIPYPETIYEVCYKPPSSLDDYFLYYFLRTDLTVGHTLARHFAWYNMVLVTQIPHDIGVVVSLSENDTLLDSTAAVKIMDKHIANLPTTAKPYVKLFWPKYGHAEGKNNPNSVKLSLKLLLKMKFKYFNVFTFLNHITRLVRHLQKNGQLDVCRKNNNLKNHL